MHAQRTTIPSPGAVTVLLFLSYADEDREIAQEIAERLDQEHVRVYPSQNGRYDDDLTIADPEGAIHQADAFLALLSPSFLASTSCRRERDLALHWEQHCQADGAEPEFVQVLQIRETPYAEAGSLRRRPWFDLTSQSAKETTLNDLASKFEPVGKSQPADNARTTAASSTVGRGPAPGFRNRDRELDAVLDGLSTEDGEHFWLVIAPPQLGKSWFLNRISANVSARARGRWVVRRVDVRDQPAEVVGNAEALIRVMFSSEVRATTDPADMREIAVDVIGNGRFHLCLLDSAELLDDNTVRRLRSGLGEINQYVEAAKNRNVRLALIVASRRDREWLGVTPKPRLRRLPLTEFKVDVIYDALQELSRSMDRNFNSDELQQHAALVHRLSEGLPALLVGYLNWIRAAQWVELRRLEDQERFDQLARPYIEQDLLSPSSLLGRGSIPTRDQRLALEQALRALSPYRLLTQSHLSHHAKRGALQTLGWSVDELWEAVSSTDLLYRPQGEPWHEIHAPIRRLLCRYWYASEDLRAQAHRNARLFVQSFAVGQLGRDQSVVLVECLWHEAQALSVSPPAEMKEKLISLARELSVGLTPSSAFTQNSLRVCAVERMRVDEELVEAVDGITGLFDELVDAVLRPA
jgi:hypothetical protein